jgi:hypothetical protein
MAKKGRPNKAQINVELWRKSNNYYRKKWFQDSQKSMDFYLNEQLTSEEKDDLREGGMPDFIINRITPAIDIMKYFVTANNPRWQAIGAEGSDSDVAHVHSMIAEYCWHLSNGKSLFGQVIQDALVKGVGMFRVDVDPDADRGIGEVMFESVDPYDVYVDPMSRDFLFRDANYIIIQKNIAKSSLAKMMPTMSKKIIRASGTTESKQYSLRDVHESETIQPGDVENEAYTLEGEKDEVLDYYEVYTKEKIQFMNVWLRQPPPPQELDIIRQEAQSQAEIMAKDIEVSLKEQELELSQLVQDGEMLPERMEVEMQKAEKEADAKMEEQKAILEAKLVEAKTKTVQTILDKSIYDDLIKDETYYKTVVEAIPFFKTQVKVCASVGDMYLYEQVLPLSEYPIIPVMYNFTGTPYAVGAVLPMVGKQREINKAHQIMLHNANLASNLRWLYTEGSVDEEEWEKYSSSPGALLKYRQGFEPPTPVQPLPINNAFYTITQEGKQDIEYISGVASQMQGVGQPQHDTYRGMLALDEYGTRRISQWVNNIVEPALEQMGKVFKEIAQFTYTAKKVFRIVQPEAGATEGEVKTASINIPIYNDFGEVIKRWNDYQTSTFDIRIVAGSTKPINRWALLDEYFKWYEAGLIDDIAMIEQTDIRNKKTLLQRKSQYAQMSGQIEQMDETIKNQQGTIDTLERQVIQAGIKDKINQGEKVINKEVTQTQAEQKLLQRMMKGEADLQKKEMKIARKNVASNNNSS